MNTPYMKILSAFALVFCAILSVFSQSVSAQIPIKTSEQTKSHPEPEIARLGFGVGIIPYIFPNNDTYNIQPAGVLSWYIPVQVGKHFRVETEFALASSQDRFPLILGTDTSQNLRNNLFFRIGVGTYYTHPFDNNTRFYAGVRSGLVSSSVEWFSTIPRQGIAKEDITYVYNESIGSFWFGGVVGFEYLLTQHISIGAELHGTSYTTGQPHTSSPIPSNYPSRFNSRFSSDAFVSSAVIALRFFF
jgi:Outer membrane protein beta-barrel domain